MKEKKLTHFNNQGQIQMVDMNLSAVKDQRTITIEPKVRTIGQTVAEMEALIAFSVAALTIL